MRIRTVLVVVLAVVTVACGSTQGARSTPSAPATSPTASPIASPSPSPTPMPVVSSGAPAWVAVSVASGWRSPQSVRAVDAPALEYPARIRDWLAHMSAADKVGLIDRLDTQILLGDQVQVLEIKSGWARVVVPDQATPLDARGYPVWVPVRQLSPVPAPESSQLLTITSPTAILTAGAQRLEVSYGTTLPILAQDAASYTVGLPGAQVMSVAASAASPLPAFTTGAAIATAARTFRSLPYLWGGTSGFGFDCSGLVHLLFKSNGVAVPRDADPQSKVGVAVARTNLQPGDLVFFSSGGVAYHVAIYSGAGRVIDSPSPGYGVEEVPLNTMPVIADYSGARRLVPSGETPTPSPSGLPASLAGAEWTKLPTTDKVVALTFDAGGNNAGVAPKERKDILEASPESFDRVVRINLRGPYFLTQAAARFMLESEQPAGKCIIFISSMSATVASINRGEYCISKAGLSMASLLWATRLAEKGISVFEVRPGIIRTDMTAGVAEKYDRLFSEGLTLQRRWGTPQDVGRAVAMLARGDLPYSTGQVILVDGGLTVQRL